MKDDSLPVKRSRASRFYDPDSSFGKRSAVGQEKKGEVASKREFTRPRIDYEKHEKNKRAAESDRIAIERDPAKNKMSASRLAYLAREEGKGGWRDNVERKPFKPAKYDPEAAAFAARKALEAEEPREERTFQRGEFREKRIEEDRGPVRRDYGVPMWKRDDRSAYEGAERPPNREERRAMEFNKRDEAPLYNEKARFTRGRDIPEPPRDEENKFSIPKMKIDKNIPLSIPYTTPASEFLYGASVVDAALNSKATHRRKLYKLYIYNGENRENESRDKEFARIARRQGVAVEWKSGDWLRMMDKMSAGRPHNGYILEASPLPKLPLAHLGKLAERDGEMGFELQLDYQSKEEKEVNGSTDFIPVPSILKSGDGRKPLILLLDSILDPGNLGGIIRTASFLGVTGIAISSRNSASFTPVVLKASAGASENVTLFTVKTPAGFIEDSKRHGWKIYAACAPGTNHSQNGPVKLTANDLYNPLHDAPSILMLGNEGEGLRWNLRSKADVEVSIEGSKDRAGVDSLNVSVATGILCTAFLRKLPIKKTKEEIEEEQNERVERILKKKAELF